MIPGYPRAVMGRKKGIRLIGLQTGISSPVSPVPGQRSGDLMLMLMARSLNSSGQPPLPAGYTDITGGTYTPNSAGDGVGIRAAYRFAAADAESPEFTVIGDNRVTLLVYRGAIGVGNFSSAQNNVAGKLFPEISGVTNEKIRIGINVYKTVPASFGSAISGFELLNTLGANGIHEVYSSDSGSWAQVNFTRSAVAFMSINLGIY